MQAFVGKAIFVRQPAFVDRIVFERQHTHYFGTLDLDDQIGAEAVMRADRLAARELPGASAVTEGFGRQGTNRAQIDHIARQLGIDCLANKRGDLGMFAAT